MTKNYIVEIKEITQIIKQKGSVKVKEGHGKVLELSSIEAWSASRYGSEGIFLIFDVFQLRSISEQFSDVSLDVIEFATKPTIYHTVKGRFLQKGPSQDGKIRFSLIKKDFWNKLLFAYGQVLILNKSVDEEFDFETQDFFPLLSAGTKEMFLSPEGEIKILKG